MDTCIEKKRQEISTIGHIAFTVEAEATVLSIFYKLKSDSNGPFETAYLIDKLETNLLHLVASYGRNSQLALAYQQLTPVEALVASMVRQQMSSKIIAEALHITPSTVNTHRSHIRKNLGLLNKARTLQSYLLSLN